MSSKAKEKSTTGTDQADWSLLTASNMERSDIFFIQRFAAQ